MKPKYKSRLLEFYDKNLTEADLHLENLLLFANFFLHNMYLTFIFFYILLYLKNEIVEYMIKNKTFVLTETYSIILLNIDTIIIALIMT